jgi:hypothetical protein
MSTELDLESIKKFEDTRITDDQADELSGYIARKCTEMELMPEQMMDGIARTLIAAADNFETNDFTLTIAGVGDCKVSLNIE